MSVTVEDGSGVADANSYVDEEDAQDYATARGLTLPADADDVTPLLIRACDYLENLEYTGIRVESTQALQWPRDYVYIDGELFTGIPTKLISAQIELAIQLNAGVDLFPSVVTGIKRETIGPITTEYFSTSSTLLPSVAKLLKDILATSISLRSLRV